MITKSLLYTNVQITSFNFIYKCRLVSWLPTRDTLVWTFELHLVRRCQRVKRIKLHRKNVCKLTAIKRPPDMGRVLVGKGGFLNLLCDSINWLRVRMNVKSVRQRALHRHENCCRLKLNFIMPISCDEWMWSIISMNMHERPQFKCFRFRILFQFCLHCIYISWIDLNTYLIVFIRISYICISTCNPYFLKGY